MTAVVGLVHNGQVFMGADAAGVSGNSLTIRRDPKVFVSGQFVIGYTSSFRMGQILQYCFTPPTPIEGDAGIEYMVRRFVPAIMEAFKSGGFEQNSDGQRSGGKFLVGWRGELYCIESDYQVARLVIPFHACGCGASIALGAMAATKSLEPTARIEAALEACEAFSTGVRRPFTIVGGGCNEP